METVLNVKNFSKSYGKFQAVKNINFEIYKGSIVGFVGKNGAGKSTALRCFTNMLFPTSGEIEILGMDSIKQAKEIKHRISYMPSETEFYEKTKVIDLFKFASKFSKGNFEKAIELSEFFELNTKKRISELSIGNRKKVSIIITLMRESELLILDEPTSGLDPLMQIKFFELILEETKRGCTIFLSSHNLTEVEKYCTRAIIIKDGEIVDDLDMETVNINHSQVVTYTTTEGVSTSFEIKGNINKLIKDLSALDLSKLEIKNKTVEDEFIDYYIGGEYNE